MFMLVGKEGSGVALQIFILVNFLNIAKVFLLRRRRVMYRLGYWSQSSKPEQSSFAGFGVRAGAGATLL